MNLSARTRPGGCCGTDHKLLMSNIRVKLKKSTGRIIVPKYNGNNISDGFKVYIKHTHTHDKTKQTNKKTDLHC